MKTPKGVVSTESMLTRASHNAPRPTCGISHKCAVPQIEATVFIKLGWRLSKMKYFIQGHTLPKDLAQFQITRSSFTAGCMAPGVRDGQMGKEKERELELP